MSLVLHITLRRLFPQLRLTLFVSAGVGALLLLAKPPFLRPYLGHLSSFEVLELLVVLALPFLLLVYNGPKCDPLDRSLSRSFAMLVAWAAVMHSFLSQSAIWPIMVVLSAIIWAQTYLLEKTDRPAACK